MQATSLPIGAEVYSADKEKLGVVDEIRGTFFKVHTKGMGPNYWLDAQNARIDPLGGRVHVSFVKNDLKDYKQHMETDLAGRPSVIAEKDPRVPDEHLASLQMDSPAAVAADVQRPHDPATAEERAFA